MSSDNLLKLLDIAIAVLGLIAGLLIGVGVSYDIGYRKGQTDALRGHQEYEMIISYKKASVTWTEYFVDTVYFAKTGFECNTKDLIKIDYNQYMAIVQARKDTTIQEYVPVDTTFVKK